MSATLLAGLLALGAAACTDDPGSPRSRETPAPSQETPAPSQSVGSRATLAPKPVPMAVSVARTSGVLRKAQERSVEKQVARILSRYFDAAYLGGRYPRARFPGAFAEFSHGAARAARGDREMLTNVSSGAVTEAVVPRRKQALLDVLAPGGKVAGVTARVRLVFLEERVDAADRSVTVSGRLLLTRAERGGLEIFGYDVARTSVVAPGRGRR